MELDDGGNDLSADASVARAVAEERAARRRPRPSATAPAAAAPASAQPAQRRTGRACPACTLICEDDSSSSCSLCGTQLHEQIATPSPKRHAGPDRSSGSIDLTSPDGAEPAPAADEDASLAGSQAGSLTSGDAYGDEASSRGTPSCQPPSGFAGGSASESALPIPPPPIDDDDDWADWE